MSDAFEELARVVGAAVRERRDDDACLRELLKRPRRVGMRVERGECAEHFINRLSRGREALRGEHHRERAGSDLAEAAVVPRRIERESVPEEPGEPGLERALRETGL
jgi:hypothetical protein